MNRRSRRYTSDTHEDTNRSWHQSAAVRVSVGLLVLAATVLTGYTAAGQTASSEREPSATVGMPAPTAATSQGVGPSEATKMICDTQTQAAVATGLALKTLPSTRSDWSNQTFVCTYDLDKGALVVTVRELADPAAALHNLDLLQRHLDSPEAIDGLAGLGLPGYRAEAGVVLFAKDNMTLEVDATAMQTTVGPNQVGRADFAYQVATNILACWKAHH